MNIKHHFFTFLFLSIVTFSFAQKPSTASIKALNNYVHFTNESIHGMMIAHRLFENFNQEVNQYVDLQSNQLNFYSNKDLPKNIFLDKEKWFYEISPYTWYATAKRESKVLKSSEAKILNQHLEKLKKIIDQVNRARFDLEHFIKNNDLQNAEKQTQIFLKLEYCADGYERFYLEKEALRKTLHRIYQKNYHHKITHKSLGVPVLKQIHNDMLPVLKSLRYEVSGNLPEYTQKLDANIRQLNSIVNIHARYKTAKDAAKDFLSNLKKYQTGASFDKKYELYGKAYYYHNIQLTAAFNSYSGRMVKSLNELIQLESNLSLLLMEEPHILKIIYPEKEIERPDNQLVIQEVPTEVNDRNVVVRQQSIIVDKREFTLQLYDHKEEDGDIVSINFNGKWIIENQELRRRPLLFKIKLNAKGENYILLHAENLGKNPPNTAAIIYFFEGKRREVVLNSNLNESEMIKFEYQDSKKKKLEK